MSCQVKNFCKNNEIKCWICRGEEPSYNELYYKPTDDPKAPKRHPLIEKEKAEKKSAAKAEKAEKSARSRDKKSKQAMAAIMEKKAHKMADKVIQNKIKNDFSKPTINSGRVNRDVDHTMLQGQIRLDSKHQSKRINHLVDLSELDEARHKSAKFNSDIGGLILWNKEGRPVVAFDYEDWLKWEASRGTNIQENN